MANVWFTSDLHLGHKNIHKFRTDFESEEQHRDVIKENYHKVVTKRDKVFFLGDIAFSHETLEDVGTWTAEKKVLIVGNHCRDKIPMQEIVKHFDEVYSLYKYKEFWLSHAPIHPAELRGKYNLHGHVHFATLEDTRYFNCCLENTEYKPIDLNRALENDLTLNIIKEKRMTIETLNAIKSDASSLRTGLLGMAGKLSLLEAGGFLIPDEVDVALDAILGNLVKILVWVDLVIQASADGGNTVEEPELTTMQAFLSELKAVFDKYAAVIEYVSSGYGGDTGENYGGASFYRLTATDPVNGNVETKDIVSATLSSEQLV